MLYALLCGYLPFDDDNISSLYKKIQVPSISPIICVSLWNVNGSGVVVIVGGKQLVTNKCNLHKKLQACVSITFPQCAILIIVLISGENKNVGPDQLFECCKLKFQPCPGACCSIEQFRDVDLQLELLHLAPVFIILEEFYISPKWKCLLLLFTCR